MLTNYTSSKRQTQVGAQVSDPKPLTEAFSLKSRPMGSALKQDGFLAVILFFNLTFQGNANLDIV